MLQKLARFILRKELQEYDTYIDKLNIRLKLRESFYDSIEESLFEYRKIEELINQNVFKSLCRLIAKEYEQTEQDINHPDDVHKFWHCQGAKSVLHTLLTIDATLKQKMQALVTKKPATENSPASVADYT